MSVVVNLCASFPQEYITLLLSDDEMQDIIEYFDQFDINQGNFNYMQASRSSYNTYIQFNDPKLVKYKIQ